MDAQNQTADLIWRDGRVPVSTRFDDPYYSLEDGLAETRHVFLAGNDLPGRFRDGFRVAELGFGTGLNFLATVSAWEDAGCPGTLHYHSFEAYPMRTADLARALEAFSGAGLRVPDLIAAWSPAVHRIVLAPEIRLEVIIGDARDTLRHWRGAAEAWFLDGFSPARNPELWTEDLMREVAAHTARNGTFATYTAAGAVRRSLQAAGFEVSRVPGFGRKRHMSRGVLAA